MAGTKRAMTWDRYTAVVLSLLVLLGGLTFAVGNQSAQHRRCITERDIGEGEHTRIDLGGSLWPLGTDCTYHYPDGSTTRLVRTPSARAWLVVVGVLLLATAAPLGVGTVLRSSQTKKNASQ